MSFFIFERGLYRLEEIEKFFKLPKSIIKHDILHTKNSLSLRLFLLIVGQACYKDGVQIKDTEIILMRGQWLRSNRKLQKDLGASPTTLTAAMRWLEKKNLLRTEKTQLGTIFTVLNFNVYQGNQENECYPMSNTRYPTSNTKEGECYPTSNTRCYSMSNNTKNYKQTKNYKEDSVNMFNSVKREKEDSVNNLYSVKGGIYDERDTSRIEWDKYPHLRF